MNDDFTLRLQERLTAADVVVTPQQSDALQRYYHLLQHWNRRMNLTALPLDAYPPSTLDRLVVEPVLAAKLISETASAWFDLGSGGGSPAIPLKIVRPGLPLTMVEATQRKAAFLREAVRDLQFDNVRVLTARIEALPQEELGIADLVTTRGLRLDPALLDQVHTILAEKGRLLVFGWVEGSVFDRFTLVVDRPLPGGSSLALLARSSA